MIVDQGWVRYLQGDYPQARQEFDRALSADPDFVPAHFRLEGWIRGLARAALENDRRRGVTTRGVMAAQYYTMLGNTGRACAALESAVPERHMTLLFLNTDPRYAHLRALPCYNAVIQQMGLPRSLSPSPASPTAAGAVSQR